MSPQLLCEMPSLKLHPRFQDELPLERLLGWHGEEQLRTDDEVEWRQGKTKEDEHGSHTHEWL